MQRRQGQRGESLLGVIAAVVILAAALSPLLLTYREVAHAVRQAELRSLALHLAREQLEILKQRGPPFDGLDSTGAQPVDGFPAFTYTTDVAAPDPQNDQMAGELKRVTVSVYHKGRLLARLSGLVSRDELEASAA